MNIILTPAVGVNYYPDGELVIRRCNHITLDIIKRADVQCYLLENKYQEDIGPITPQRFARALEHIKIKYEDAYDFYVLDRDIEKCFIMPAPLYCLEAKTLRRVWIPESWKTIES